MDYCGYCGREYNGPQKEICPECYSDPEVRVQYDEDSAYDAAEAAHDEDLREEYESFYERG